MNALPHNETAQAQAARRTRIDAWRGVAAEHADLDTEGGRFVKHRARKLLWQLLRPFRWWLVALAILVLVENAARLSIPRLVQLGIDQGLVPLGSSGDATILLQILLIMGLAIIFQAVGRVIFLRKSGRIGQDAMLTLRRRLFAHFQKLDLRFHDKYTSGRVVSRLSNDLDSIAEMLNSGFDSLITAMLTIVGVIIMLLAMDWRLGLITLVCIFPLALLTRWFSRNSARAFRKVRDDAALVIVHFVESMTGIKAVQAYRREPRNQEIYTDLAVRYAATNRKTFSYFAVFQPGVKLIGNVTVAVVLLLGGWFVMTGNLTIGVLSAFLIYLKMFFDPMQEVGMFYNSFQSAVAALEKLSGVLEEEPSVQPPAQPIPLPTAVGELQFREVEFSYVPEQMILPGLNLHVPAGQTLALVGTTGAGKTTIAKLMSRLYDPTSGQITLDGVDLRDLTDEDLRRAVVLVTQENFVFAGSIAENIAFGKPGAENEEIVAAAQAVGAHEFISQLPQGYATDTGKRGSRLSAGQRQLIAFTRAFLADPAVLILDEATSSLDVPTERQVQQALETVLRERTAVIIAHRLSTVEIADRVIVLEHGKIIEDGDPQTLSSKADGRYAALHQAWVESLA